MVGRVDRQDDDLDLLSELEEGRGLRGALLPRQVADVYQPLDPGGHLDEDPKVGDRAHGPLQAGPCGHGRTDLGPRIRQRPLAAQAQASLGHVDVEHHRLDLLAVAQHVFGVGDFAQPVDLRDVHEALDAGLELHERAELHQADHRAFDPLPGLVALVRRQPGILLQILEAQADLARPGVEILDDGLDLLPHLHHVLGLAHTAPAQVRDVDQGVDAPDVHERAEARGPHDPPSDLAADLELVDASPSGPHSLLLEQRPAADDGLAVALVELDDPDLQRAAHPRLQVRHRPAVHLGGRQEGSQAQVDRQAPLHGGDHDDLDGLPAVQQRVDALPDRQRLRLRERAHDALAAGDEALPQDAELVAHRRLRHAGPADVLSGDQPRQRTGQLYEHPALFQQLEHGDGQHVALTGAGGLDLVLGLSVFVFDLGTLGLDGLGLLGVRVARLDRGGRLGRVRCVDRAIGVLLRDLGVGAILANHRALLSGASGGPTPCLEPDRGGQGPGTRPRLPLPDPNGAPSCTKNPQAGQAVHSPRAPPRQGPVARVAILIGSIGGAGDPVCCGPRRWSLRPALRAHVAQDQGPVRGKHLRRQLVGPEAPGPQKLYVGRHARRLPAHPEEELEPGGLIRSDGLQQLQLLGRHLQIQLLSQLPRQTNRRIFRRVQPPTRQPPGVPGPEAVLQQQRPALGVDEQPQDPDPETSHRHVIQQRSPQPQRRARPDGEHRRPRRRVADQRLEDLFRCEQCHTGTVPHGRQQRKRGRRSARPTAGRAPPQGTRDALPRPLRPAPREVSFWLDHRGRRP